MESFVICESVSTPAWSETLCTYGSYLHGSREIPPLSLEMLQGPRCESGRNTTAMYGGGKSDRLIVAEKRSNKDNGAPWLAENVEPSSLTKGNSFQLTKYRTQRRGGLRYGQL
jgi:RNA-directed DNA polymerase